MINGVQPGLEGSTRDRLLAAGVRLFAERGFRGTTVGDIEAAAGLRPRRGALYHYFPTKQALLEAAVETHLEVIEHGRRQLARLPLRDVRMEAVLMARWFLGELDRVRDLTRILEQDGDRLPEIRDLARERIVEVGHRAAEQALARWLDGRRPNFDSEAVAVLLVGSLVNFRRSAWTFGAPTFDLRDERVIQAWAKACVGLVDQLERAAGPAGP
jgi:AcrR family transcriptional regulator